MKWIVVAIATLLPINQAMASTALVCLFKPLSLRFNVIENNNQQMIQWDGGAFQAVVVNFEKPYLTIEHYASTATFKALIDVSVMKGYGSIKMYSGEKSEGEIVCAFD